MYPCYRNVQRSRGFLFCTRREVSNQRYSRKNILSEGFIIILCHDEKSVCSFFFKKHYLVEHSRSRCRLSMLKWKTEIKYFSPFKRAHISDLFSLLSSYGMPLVHKSQETLNKHCNLWSIYIIHIDIIV